MEDAPVVNTEAAPKKKRRLSKKQRGFVKDYALTENGTQSALKHYDVKDSIVAKAIASENLTKPYILDAVKAEQKRLVDAVPRELAEQVLVDGLRANRVISANITYGDADEKTNDFIEVPDHAIRHRFFDSYVKMTGEYAPEKHLNVNVEVEPSDELRALADQLNAQ